MTLNRLNVTRACDSCKTLKVKCDTGTPKCTQCIKRNQECTYFKRTKEDNELFRDLFPEAIDYLNNAVMEDNESLRKTFAREQLTIFRYSILQSSSFENFMSYRVKLIRCLAAFKHLRFEIFTA
ncbi:C6 transcription factor [Gigaspora margarita]|uniref:C6 transcription factor n=1 Tax=Gigaspora margarita TaxID=4874 RepID=A0A8H4EM70_GIGMA|nr:C6 transcription factor [Gigaspora margarita]